MEQTELKGMIRLEQIGVKASGEKRGRSERSENITKREREEMCQKRKEKCSEKIRSDSEKIIVEQSEASSVVQNDVERGEYPIRKGRITTVAKYTEK